MRLSISLAVALIAAAASPVWAAKIAVLDVERTDVSEPLAATVQEMLVQEVVRARPKDTVISGNDVASLLKVEKQRMAFTVSDQNPFDNIARALSADLVVAATIKLLAGQPILSVSLIDSASASLQARETVQLKGTGTELIPQIGALVRGLFGARGTLQLINQVEGAQVYLNGQFIGKMPLEKLAVKQTGTYELKVLHDDYAPFVRMITISPGSVTRVPLWLYKYTEITDRSTQRKYWGWGLVGAGAAAAGASVWQYRSALDARDAYDAEIGEPTPSTQVAAKRSRLDSLERDANSRRSTAFLLGGAGAAAIGSGTYLIVFNPWADMLQEIAGVRPGLVIGADRLLAVVRFGGAR